MGLLAAIRARVAARGMTFTELAHASGVQPGNLRRMLTSTTASPRLGSVMRLLPPLHCRIGRRGPVRRSSSLHTWRTGGGPAHCPGSNSLGRPGRMPARSLHVSVRTRSSCRWRW